MDLKEERVHEGEVAREGGEPLRHDRDGNAACEGAGRTVEPHRCEEAARAERHEVGDGAHELAPLQELAHLLAGGHEGDVGVDAEDAGHKGEDDGVRMGRAPPDPADQRAGNDDREIDPDELEPAQKPARLGERDPGDGGHPSAHDKRQRGIERDRREDGEGPAAGGARLCGPVAPLPEASTARGRRKNPETRKKTWLPKAPSRLTTPRANAVGTEGAAPTSREAPCQTRGAGCGRWLCPRWRGAAAPRGAGLRRGAGLSLMRSSRGARAGITGQYTPFAG